VVVAEVTDKLSAGKTRVGEPPVVVEESFADTVPEVGLALTDVLEVAIFVVGMAIGSAVVLGVLSKCQQSPKNNE
jgi:hypothetical protein